MKTFSQDGTNDIYLDENGQISLSYGRDAYSHIMADAIRTVLGEVPLDTSLGIPYFNTVLGIKPIDVGIWKSNVRDRILAFPFVIAINAFDTKVDYVKKVLSYRLEIETDSGVVSIDSQA